MGHQESYRQNEAYAEFLAGWDEKFYAKYIALGETGDRGRKRVIWIKSLPERRKEVERLSKRRP